MSVPSVTVGIAGEVDQGGSGVSELADFDLDRSTSREWRRFQARLADHLADMVEDDLLILETESVLRDGEDVPGASPYVQFCAWGEDMMRCEAVSNHYLAPRHRLAQAAEEALVALGFASPTYA